MILLPSVVAGVLVGWGWAGRLQVKYEVPVLHHLWLIPVAFLPQAVTTQPSPLLLMASQLLLIGFAFLNRQNQGMKILMAGALLNFAVMIVNTGLMPVSPQTAGRLIPENIVSNIPFGGRFGPKDILLPVEQTRLEWLADRFLPPAWLPYQVAFSLGDIFIAAGAFWLLARQRNIQQGYNP